MSADGSITLTWAGEERKFRLAIGQLRELQENINRPRVAIGAPPIGPRTLLRILSEGDAWPDEAREIIRLGLIGGGMPIDRVPALIKRYAEERPLVESAQVAQVILLAALVGVPDDPVGKKRKRRRRGAEAMSSASPPSTEPDVQSDIHQSKSTECRSGSFPPASMDGIEPTDRTTSPRP